MRKSEKLPGSWESVPLAKLAERNGGGTPSRKNASYFVGNMPWFTVADLPPVGTAPPILTSAREAISEDGLENSSAKRLPTDSVLFATRVTPGKTAIAGCEVATNQDFRSVLPGPAHVPMYLAYFLSHVAVYGLPEQRGTTIKGITAKSFDSIDVPVPPLNEQRRIVAKIEELSARSRTAKQALDAIPPLLERFRQSVLAAAFRGDLTKQWRQQNPKADPAACDFITGLKRLRLRAVKPGGRKTPKPCEPDLVNQPVSPSSWPIFSIDQVCSHITSGSRDWKPFYGKGEGTFLMAQNIRPLHLDLSFRQPVDPPAKDKSRLRTQVEAGDVLVTIVGANTGDTCYVEETLQQHYVCQSVALIRPLSPLLGKFLCYYLNSPSHGGKLFLQYMYGAARPHLSFEQLKMTAVALPAVAEQREILRRIDECFQFVSAVEAALTHEIDPISVLDQSILAKAFRGALVPQDPNDEPASSLLERIESQRQ